MSQMAYQPGWTALDDDGQVVHYAGTLAVDFGNGNVDVWYVTFNTEIDMETRTGFVTLSGPNDLWGEAYCAASTPEEVIEWASDHLYRPAAEVPSRW